MSQGNLFTTSQVHFGPKPNAGLPNWKRVALCGVTYAIAGSDPDCAELGSSRLDLVTCAPCLEMANGKAEQ